MKHQGRSIFTRLNSYFENGIFHMFTVDLYVQYLTTIVVEFILYTFYKSKLNVNNGSKDKRNILQFNVIS